MRIGILTQPLFCNYGGIVQCYALQTTLQRMGHEVIILQREFKREYTLKGALSYYSKHLVKLLMGRQSSWHYYVAQERRDYIAKETCQFVEKNMYPRSVKCYSTAELKAEVDRQELDAIIVGSDQVWRPDYSPCQPNYFLDFLPTDSKIKRISYAASFGSDDWTFSPELAKQCGDLLKRFDAVSVREQSAVRLCKEYFGVDALQVLDPTMLLEQEDYKAIVDKKQIRGGLFCYMLDRMPEKRNIIAHISEKAGLKVFESMPKFESSIYNLYGDIDQCVYPSVEDWLSAFLEAKMIVTDSFHGTVFSIINNKPFWVIGNRGRGMARFESLLSQYNLQGRLIASADLDQIDVDVPIDWSSVNAKRMELQELSNLFIKNALK